MPVIHLKEEPNFKLGIWKMDEEVEAILSAGLLSDKDVARVTAFKSIARMKEWICTRLLLKELLPEQNAFIVYDENGKPFLENSTAHISVSHTKEFVGVIVSDKYAVSIDLELIHPRIQKIVHRFVSDDELKFVDEKNLLEYYFIIWSAKEVLYKMYGKKELLFKEHLAVKPFQFNGKGEVTASIIKDEHRKEFLLQYELMNDLLLVYAVDEKDKF